MSPDLLGSLVNGAIPFFAGLYCWLLGTRRIGKAAGMDVEYDAWHERFGKACRLLGPLAMMFGVLTVLVELTRDR
ncbi:hypothetical protein [Paludisphaera mucosa]|uniref:Uncharacterized protein n=1 Tax=Paludisphaera mucosa TaxID=3030827 RepID=A0ABT6FBU1_9BACT|nr:hypothetical protein [Paludisphaera mucosa]MDG3005016.1 hypothetical protein [Paludisphaera mucosa]